MKRKRKTGKNVVSIYTRSVSNTFNLYMRRTRTHKCYHTSKARERDREEIFLSVHACIEECELKYVLDESICVGMCECGNKEKQSKERREEKTIEWCVCVNFTIDGSAYIKAITITCIVYRYTVVCVETYLWLVKNELIIVYNNFIYFSFFFFFSVHDIVTLIWNSPYDLVESTAHTSAAHIVCSYVCR